jgi:hypothetical protein
VEYQDEVADPFGRPRTATPVAPDLELRERYRALIALRKAHVELFVDGATNLLHADDGAGVLVYERVWGEGPDAARAVVAFNTGEARATVTVPVPAGRYERAFAAGASRARDVVGSSGGTVVADGETGLELVLPPRGGVLWLRE